MQNKNSEMVLVATNFTFHIMFLITFGSSIFEIICPIFQQFKNDCDDFITMIHLLGDIVRQIDGPMMKRLSYKNCETTPMEQ